MRDVPALGRAVAWARPLRYTGPVPAAAGGRGGNRARIESVLIFAIAFAVLMAAAAAAIMALRRRALRKLAWSGQALLGASVIGVFQVDIGGALAPWFDQDPTDIVTKVAGILWWLALAWLTVECLEVFLWRGLLAIGERRRVPRLLSDLSTGLIYVSAVIAIIYFVFGQSVTGLLATSGVVAVVIGFALQNTLSDFFSGIALNFEGAFHEGEWIGIDGTIEGRVDEVNWRATRLRMRTGNMIIVPNSTLARAQVTNFTYPDTNYAIFLRLWIDYSVPANRVKALLDQAARAADIVLPKPAPFTVIEEYGEWAMRYRLKYWVDDYGLDPQNQDVVATMIHYHLQRAGIRAAVPRREVTLGERPALDLPSADDAEAMLERVAVFQSLSGEDRAALAARMEPELFASGEPLVREGEAGASLFVIAEGELDVAVRTRGDQTRKVATLAAGQSFGEMSLLTGEARNATVIAAGDVLVYEIAKADIEPLLRDRPEVAEHMSRLLAERQAVTDSARSSADSEADRKRVHTHAEEIMNRVRHFFGLKPRH